MDEHLDSGPATPTDHLLAAAAPPRTDPLDASPPQHSGSVSGPPPSYFSATDAHANRNPPFVAADYAHDSKKHCLLCASGSVATIKLPKICEALSTSNRISIRIILTSSAAQFLAGQSAEQPTVSSLLAIPNVDGVYTDADEWAPPWTRNAGVTHIELRRWSDICVVAPLSANTMAKMTNGIADNLLTSVLRAWDTTDSIENRGRSVEGGLRKRIIVAIAMNTAMWQHPITHKQLKVLTEEWGVNLKGRYARPGWVEVLTPSTKMLACGDVGIGAMIPYEEIVQIIRNRLYLGLGS
jgi:phosphopantothenoylcysteine decarboxylase